MHLIEMVVIDFLPSLCRALSGRPRHLNTPHPKPPDTEQAEKEGGNVELGPIPSLQGNGTERKRAAGAFGRSKPPTMKAWEQLGSPELAGGSKGRSVQVLTHGVPVFKLTERLQQHDSIITQQCLTKKHLDLKYIHAYQPRRCLVACC